MPSCGNVYGMPSRKIIKIKNKEGVWQEISFHIGVDVDIVEKLMKSRLPQHWRQGIRVVDAKRSGSGAVCMRITKWFVY